MRSDLVFPRSRSLTVAAPTPARIVVAPALLCHRVDLFDDYMPNEIPDMPSVGGEAPGESNPNLAFLFAEGGGSTNNKPPVSGKAEKEELTKTIVSSTLVVDPIFAQNHGLFSDTVEGSVKVKKYHHPPVGR